VSIRIVTDSTADLPPEVASKHQIEVVPLAVLFGDEELRDGVDITAERFFTRMQREAELPTTSQPSAGAFRQVYERLAGEGATEIMSIHISSKLSGTLEAAYQGAAGLDVRVVHVDSQLTSLALGLGVIAAAEAVRDGATVEETRALVDDQFRRTHTFFVLDSVENLRRGGRIGRAQGFVGSLLKVKPILAFEAGEVVPVARARTRPRAIEEALRRAAACRPIIQAMAVHATTPDDLEYVASRLRGLAPDAPIMTGMLGPTLGVYGGPGLLGLAVVSSPTSSG
jgi:DegV family protein with EDD domain